jgi:broad specificity phosphatase PhoE
MSDENREQLRERIEAAEARQAERERAAQASAADRLTSIAREHPVLLIAGGLAIGAVLSTLVPKSPTRKLSKNALGFLGTIAELGIAYGRQAMEAAEEAGQNGMARLSRSRGTAAEDEVSEEFEQEPASVEE